MCKAKNPVVAKSSQSAVIRRKIFASKILNVSFSVTLINKLM